MQSPENINDDFLFIDDSDDEEILSQGSDSYWKVLIVDDDPEIHAVTQLALSDLVVLGRKLEYIHAYSGEQAREMLAEHDDIVLVLLDVVMESDDAGLQVVRYIREQLSRQDTRIVLRTGQPGYAPEESVIKDYDINDYKTKTELTRRKLVTTVYAAIRSYQQIATVNENRQGLETIVSAATELFECYSIQDYAEQVLAQLSNLLGNIEQAVFCARGQGKVADADDLSLYTFGQLGLSGVLVGQKLETMRDDEMVVLANQAFSQKKHIINQEHAAFFLSSGARKAVICFTLQQELSAVQQQLIEVFLTNISVGYENVHLFQKLTDAAYKDWLTDLPNRAQFVNLLDDFASSQDQNLVAALVDINHFSDVNEGLGQEVGNLLLNAVSQRLSGICPGCKIARVGADVFGLIGSKEVINPETLSLLFNQPFAAGDHNLPINACFGFCTVDNAGSRGVNVLNQINIALNLAKKDRLVSHAYYSPEMEEQTQWRLRMIRQLRTDFADNRLALWYQPQLSLTTGKVIGAEALLRWQTADGSFVSPGVFIPLAEYSGLILDIGDWVVKQACQQIRALDQQGFDDISISVNVSIPQFRREGFAESIINATKQADINPSRLELEITESILMDDPKAIVAALVELKQEGISIALDDFGTGYSSLSYLQKLPLDRLKVDRAFVNDINDSGNTVIADTIINLGKQMHLKVIAEGIENLEQQEHLIAQGCDEVQGFYYAKPMPSEEFFAFLKQQ
ncbi:EAL domain-containing protein [Endozoicomonas sp. G2_1]|uniref:bifunctional diguanylate cyclase/phosphodiesterase n=1 Tax=Endozoicomonas sp. G2_1 TaxID=2821091 RepID=UPI001ADB7282|nr:EAL domain-containing protein [Endozoicomonas sp. G2_1]MBO9489712.1 EAL domain-containing protein [Endozoicomonas sp. G2_1]